MKIDQATLRSAIQRIKEAEFDLGYKLSEGQCRDLLMDNTPWDSDVIAAVVSQLWEA